MRYRVGVVVALAVVPDQLQVVQRLLHEPVLVTAQFLADRTQVHRVLDDEGVVGEAERWVRGMYFSSRPGSGSRRTPAGRGWTG